jgi:hypothetical protein
VFNIASRQTTSPRILFSAFRSDDNPQQPPASDGAAAAPIVADAATADLEAMVRITDDAGDAGGGILVAIPSRSMAAGASAAGTSDDYAHATSAMRSGGDGGVEDDLLSVAGGTSENTDDCGSNEYCSNTHYKSAVFNNHKTYITRENMHIFKNTVMFMQPSTIKK